MFADLLLCTLCKCWHMVLLVASRRPEFGLASTTYSAFGGSAYRRQERYALEQGKQWVPEEEWTEEKRDAFWEKKAEEKRKGWQRQAPWRRR